MSLYKRIHDLTPEEVAERRSTAVRTAIVSGIFVLVVTGVLFAHYKVYSAKDPIGSKAVLDDMRMELFQNPGNQQLRQEIRQRDQQLRQAYFRHQELGERISFALLGGLLVFFSAAAYAAAMSQPVPYPGPKPPAGSQAEAARKGRWGVAIAAGVIGIAALVWLLLSPGWNARVRDTETEQPQQQKEQPQQQDGAGAEDKPSELIRPHRGRPTLAGLGFDGTGLNRTGRA